MSALCRFLVTDGQNTCDHITRCRRSKPAWSNCILCIPFILNGSPNKCCPHTCNACIITTWRLGLPAPLLPTTTSTIIVPVNYYLLQIIHTCCIHIQCTMLTQVFLLWRKLLTAQGLFFSRIWTFCKWRSLSWYLLTSCSRRSFCCSSFSRCSLLFLRET